MSEDDVKGFSIYSSYYSIAKRLDPERQARFFMAMCAYAFDSEEPDFGGDLVMEVAFDGVRVNVRKSADGSKYGKMGGRPKGKNPPKNPPLNPIEKPFSEGLKPCTKPPFKPKGKERIGTDRIGGNNNHPTDDDYYSPTSEDGDNSEATKPVCECGQVARFDVKSKTWRCADCGDIKPNFEKR